MRMSMGGAMGQFTHESSRVQRKSGEVAKFTIHPRAFSQLHGLSIDARIDYLRSRNGAHAIARAPVVPTMLMRRAQSQCRT
jgi:hypothetical protein